MADCFICVLVHSDPRGEFYLLQTKHFLTFPSHRANFETIFATCPFPHNEEIVLSLSAGLSEIGLLFQFSPQLLPPTSLIQDVH